MPKLNLVGFRFGMLVVTRYTHSNNAGMSHWECICDCGETTIKALGNLRSGHTRSCGCLRAIATRDCKTRHAMSGNPTYKSWSGMLTRCRNKANHKYPSYGGRGIKVCSEWESFDLFLADMGMRPEGTTLGRINNDGDYKPSNCEWQDATTQARNKRNTRLFEYNGSLKTLAAHCESVGLPQSAIKGRVYMQGMTMTEAISKSINQPA